MPQSASNSASAGNTPAALLPLFMPLPSLASSVAACSATFLALLGPRSQAAAVDERWQIAAAAEPSFSFVVIQRRHWQPVAPLFAATVSSAVIIYTVTPRRKHRVEKTWL